MHSIKLYAAIKRFRDDRRGTTAIILALAFIPVLGIVGAAIDLTRAHIVKTRLQGAIDAAVLAAASSGELTKSQRIAKAESVFAANFPADELGDAGVPSITIDDEGKIVGTANADLGTSIMSVLGFDSMDVSADAEAFSGKLTQGEIILVLDYSGSMNSDGKYQSMRDAATSLINQLTQDGTHTGVKFGLVPFSEHVYGTMESDFIVDEVPGGSWTNCTRDRRWSHNIQDSTPLSAVDASKWGMQCTPSGGGEEEEGGSACAGGGEEEEGGSSCTCDAYAICSNYVSRNLVMQPLTTNYSQLTAQLASMTPYANTHISLGLAMGWHMISPNAPWQEGSSYGTSGMVKAIVLLTDGAQTTAAWGPGDSSSVSNAESNLEDMCQSIKAQDVKIVTVAFDLDDTNTKTRLQNCATSPTHFFHEVETGAELVAAFQKIAGQLAKDMYLSK